MAAFSVFSTVGRGWGSTPAFRPASRAQRKDPYPVYRALRAWDPVHYDSRSESYVLTRYEDILEVLQESKTRVDRSLARLSANRNPFRQIDEDFSESLSNSLYRAEGQQHRELRESAQAALTPWFVRRFRPRIEWVANRLLEAAAKRRRAEWMRDFALPLPSIALADILGIPQEERREFRRWSTDLSALLDPVGSEGGIRKASAAHQELSAVLRRIIRERRRSPGGDLLSALLQSSPRELSDRELLGFATHFIGVGRETCTNLLGNAMTALGANPAAKALLVAEPERIPDAIEEILRYESPVQVIERVTASEQEIGEVSIPEGTLIKLVLGAANRDPAVFSQPDAFDLGRGENPHLAFGAAPRDCIGAELARLIAGVCLGTLSAEYPNFQVKGPKAWLTSETLRGPIELTVQLRP